MNILFIATVYNHLAVFHKPFIKYFQDNGYTVHVAGSNSMGRKEDLEQLGTICHDINFDKSIISFNNNKAFNELNKLFNEIQFDLIHVHTPIAAFLVRLVLRNKKNQGSLVYTAHGFHFFKGAPIKNWLFYYSAERIAASWTDHLITINFEDFTNATKFLDINKISLVPGIGVESAVFNLTIEEKILFKRGLGIEEKALVISYIAELNKNKNHLFLLKNWKKIKEQNSNFVLLIIGEGKEGLTLKKYVEKEGLEGIHFLGYRNDIAKVLQITDVVSLLSWREGLPKSIMEAMVYKIPCVVTNSRGLRDLVKSNKNGYVIDHKDDERLIKAFASLGKSKELREMMGEEAENLIKPLLLENVMKEYKLIYNQLLN